ncbi:MAG: sigma 54-interacting transcriptional regulator, partial [Myxococcota bacterium]
MPLSADPILHWSLALELQVVKKIRKVLSRRWRLGFGYIDVKTDRIAPPSSTEFANLRGLCQVIQDIASGSRACSDTARQTMAELNDRARSGNLSARPWTITCHAGLQELVAPVVIEDKCFGALLCGGFFIGGTEVGERGDRHRLDTLAALNQRTRKLGLAPGECDVARRNHPWMSPRELELASELLEAAAEEIASFCSERLRKQQADRAADEPRHNYGAIMGKSPPMQELYSILDRVIPSDSTVLIQGENGTGKELVARAIHYGSRRKHRRFVVTNCSAFNDNLLDSELFGHKKGAFTGAIADKQGLFEAADRSTFFLDEIG